MVGGDQGVACLLQGGQEVKGLLESILDSGRRFPTGRILHVRSLSRGCTGSLSRFPGASDPSWPDDGKLGGSSGRKPNWGIGDMRSSARWGEGEPTHDGGGIPIGSLHEMGIGAEGDSGMSVAKPSGNGSNVHT